MPLLSDERPGLDISLTASTVWVRDGSAQVLRRALSPSVLLMREAAIPIDASPGNT